MVENLSKFLRTKNKLGQIDGFEQKRCTKVHTLSDSKSKEEANREAALQLEASLQLETAPGHLRTATNVRREHQAHTPSSEESTKRTVHIQQWGSHPLSLAGWQGPAKRFAN